MPLNQTTNNDTPQEAAEKAWFRATWDIDLSGDELRKSKPLAMLMFRAGAQYNHQVSTGLSPHIARFMEYVMWLDPVGQQREEKVDARIQEALQAMSAGNMQHAAELLIDAWADTMTDKNASDDEVMTMLQSLANGNAPTK